MTSYADHLRPFLPYLPSALVSAQCLQQILHATRNLPGALGLGPFMVECGLDEEPVADFSVAVLESRDGPALLSQVEPSERAPAGPDDAWRRIHQLARCWSDPTSLLGRVLHQVWLEFDVGLTRGGNGRAPSVFAGIGPGVDAVPVARDLLDVLLGERSPRATPAALTECIRRLPPGSSVLFVGAMLARGTTAVRLVTSTTGRAQGIEFLERCGLPDVEASLPLLAEVEELADEMWLAVDVDGSGMRPRTGVDLYCDASASRALLDLLVERGLCTPGKRAALVRAEGMAAPEFDDGVRAGRLATVLGPGGLDRLDLSLHHVKLVGGPGVPAQAKAYLCGSYR